MTTNEKNRMIAEFCDELVEKGFINRLAPDSENMLENRYRRSCNNHLYYLANAQFDISYDWIMPVLCKIRGMGYNVQIGGVSSINYNVLAKQKIAKEQGIDWFDLPPIAETVNGFEVPQLFDLAFQFIEWYTTQQKEAGDE